MLVVLKFLYFCVTSLFKKKITCVKAHLFLSHSSYLIFVYLQFQNLFQIYIKVMFVNILSPPLKLHRFYLSLLS